MLQSIFSFVAAVSIDDADDDDGGGGGSGSDTLSISVISTALCELICAALCGTYINTQHRCMYLCVCVSQGSELRDYELLTKIKVQIKLENLFFSFGLELVLRRVKQANSGKF